MDDVPGDKEIRVVVADDHVEFRQRLKELIEEAPDMTVVGEAPEGKSAVSVTRERRPDVVLMDLHMPLMDGIDATAALSRLDEPPSVIVLTSSDTPDDVLDAIAAGAAGYLLKGASGEELWEAVRAGHAGRSPMSPEVTGALLQQVRDQRASGGPRPDRGFAAARPGDTPSLTDRETAMLKLLAEGRDNGQIAEELCLSTATVKGGLSNLFAKLGVRSRAQAAVVAVRNGLV